MQKSGKSNKLAFGLLGGSLLIVVALIAFFLLSGGKPEPSKARIGGEFTLVDQNGKTVTSADFHGKHMLLYFGYTFCPDVCPTSLSTIAAALDKLSADQRSKVRPVFISVDPERDSPAFLKDYMAAFGPEFIGLTGSQEQIKKVATAWGVYYRKVEEEGASDYLMDHTSYTYLMDQNGDFVTVFKHGIAPEQMAESLAFVLDGKQ